MISKFFNLFFALFFFFNSTYFAQYSVIIKYSAEVSLNDINISYQSQSLLLTGFYKPKKEFRVKKITNEKFGLNKREQEIFGRYLKIIFSDKQDAENFLKLAAQEKNIVYADYVRVLKINGDAKYNIANDPYLSKQWHLTNVKIFDSWNITEGSDTIIVAIIDTGIDYNHEDLRDNIFINKKESLNGKDDDGNGFVDDIMGYDFVDRRGYPYDGKEYDFFEYDNDPYDEHGHGTAVAGIISAVKNNGIGISGAAPGAKLLCLRAFDKNGEGEEDDVAAAILYAANMNAKIINMSFGDDKFSLLLYEVIKYAYEKNIVMIASAGNSNSNLPHYPSGFSEVISVGASDKSGYKANFSNYGSTIDLIAPGVDIYTTYKDNAYNYFSGTSASSPIVSACVALILSVNNFSPSEIKQILRNTSDDIGTIGWDEKTGAGKINFLKAIQSLTNGIIKFDYPLNNQSFYKRISIPIYATVASPYFKDFSIYYAKKEKIQIWRPIFENINRQAVRKYIGEFNISNLESGTYELAIKVNYKNGYATEERITFYITDDSLETETIFFGLVNAGTTEGLFAACVSKRLLPVKLYYKNINDTFYNYIYLDGITNYIKNASLLSYGFVQIRPSTLSQTYEAFLHSVDFDGKEKLISEKSIFTIEPFKFNNSYLTKSYSLPPGQLYEEIANFNDGKDYLFFNSKENPQYTKILKFNNGIFNVVDSIMRRPKYFGKLNSYNQNNYLISILGRDGYIDKQSSSDEIKFDNIFFNASGKYWFAGAFDLFGNDNKYILSISSQKTIDILYLDERDNLLKYQELSNFANNLSNDVSFDFASVVVSDVTGDGNNEILAMDTDGNLLIYKRSSQNKFIPYINIKFALTGSNKLIKAGDIDGDGINEIACVLFSNEFFANSPFAILKILKIENDYPTIIFENAYIDYKSVFANNFITLENAMRFYDLDSDGKKEILFSFFPNLYVYKYSNQKIDRILLIENSNTSSIFIGDLDKNGKKEFSVSASKEIKFLEIDTENTLKTPLIIDYYLEENQQDTIMVLKWIGEGNSYQIYAGESNSQLNLISESNITTYIVRYDKKLKYWSVKAKVNDNYSNFSNIVEPALNFYPDRIIEIKTMTNKSLIAKFSKKINTDFFNPSMISVNEYNLASSIVRIDDFSVLISFENEFSSGYNLLAIKAKNKTYTHAFAIDNLETIDYLYILSYDILTNKSVKINFNFSLDVITALQLENYKVSNNNKAIRIELSNDKKSVVIHFKNPIVGIGKETILRLSNIRSSEETGKLNLASFASVIAIVDVYNNLSEVFAYPNPALIKNGKITFASLPKKCFIYIYDISGRLVKTIEKNSLDSGIDWDFKDKNGDIIGSGIYIYLIKAFDDSGNETETVIKKFAVIK